MGFALSTTQVCSIHHRHVDGKKGSKVNWGVAGKMLIACIVTFPAAGTWALFACALAKMSVWGTVVVAFIACAVAFIIWRLSCRNPINRKRQRAEPT